MANYFADSLPSLPMLGLDIRLAFVSGMWAEVTGHQFLAKALEFITWRPLTLLGVSDFCHGKNMPENFIGELGTIKSIGQILNRAKY